MADAGEPQDRRFCLVDAHPQPFLFFFFSSFSFLHLFLFFIFSSSSFSFFHLFFFFIFFHFFSSFLLFFIYVYFLIFLFFCFCSSSVSFSSSSLSPSSFFCHVPGTLSCMLPPCFLAGKAETSAHGREKEGLPESKGVGPPAGAALAGALGFRRSGSIWAGGADGEAALGVGWRGRRMPWTFSVLWSSLLPARRMLASLEVSRLAFGSITAEPNNRGFPLA